jgi:hypothetical protein
MKWMRDAREDHGHRRVRGGPALLTAAVLLFTPMGKAQVINGGFESATPIVRGKWIRMRQSKAIPSAPTRKTQRKGSSRF